MADNGDQCVVCKWRLPENSVRELVRSDQFVVACPICGNYEITAELVELLELEDPEVERLKPALSAAIRQLNDTGASAELDDTSWKELAIAVRAIPVSKRIRQALERLAADSKYAGEWVSYRKAAKYRLMARAGAESINELNYILEALVRTRFETRVIVR